APRDEIDSTVFPRNLDSFTHRSQFSPSSYLPLAFFVADHIRYRIATVLLKLVYNTFRRFPGLDPDQLSNQLRVLSTGRLYQSRQTKQKSLFSLEENYELQQHFTLWLVLQNPLDNCQHLAGVKLKALFYPQPFPWQTDILPPGNFGSQLG